MMEANKLELKDKPSTNTTTKLLNNNLHTNKTSSSSNFKIPSSVAAPKRNLVIVPKSNSSNNVPVPNKVLSFTNSNSNSSSSGSSDIKYDGKPKKYTGHFFI
jgi:hypothetical protein